MTNDEFQMLFDAVFHGIPDYAKSSITEYIKKSVRSEIVISDEAANKAEKTSGVDIPSAHLLATDTNWHYVFRRFLLDAPKDILESIIRHEIIHGFLISVERLPTEVARKQIDKYKQGLETILREKRIELPKSYDITEDLVCVINDDWGGDDVGAKEWLQEAKCKTS